MTTISITPITWIPIAPQANTLGVRLISDNLSSAAKLYWSLTAVTPASGNTAAVSTPVASGNLEITGTDYTGWDGDNTFPFTFTCSKLGLTAGS